MAMTDLLDLHEAPLAGAAVWSHADEGDRVSFAGQVFGGTLEECWIFCGGIESLGGYGRWRPPRDKVTSTHRWSFIAHNGPTNEPVIRHDCDIRPCVNPHHLIDGTQAQNIRDTVERGAWRPIALPIWPHRAFTLRAAARLGDRDTINEICERAEQLRLFPTPQRTR